MTWDDSNKFKNYYYGNMLLSKKTLPRKANINNGSYDSLARVSTDLLKK